MSDSENSIVVINSDASVTDTQQQKRLKVSPIWDHFTKIKWNEKDEKNSIQCNICSK